MYLFSISWERIWFSLNMFPYPFTVHTFYNANKDFDNETWQFFFGKNFRFCDGKGCRRSYHLSCLDPPLNNVPYGVWHCLHCVKKKIEFGVHSACKGLESIWDAREVEVSGSFGRDASTPSHPHPLPHTYTYPHKHTCLVREERERVGLQIGQMGWVLVYPSPIIY